MKKYTFRQSDFSNFFYSPSSFVERFLNKDSFIPNDAMKFGTKEHKKKEISNGDFAEVEIEIPFEGHNIVGHIDYYDGEKIIDYKFTQKIDKFEGYKFQVAFYQWLVYKKYGKIVPAILEMNQVEEIFDGFKTTGKILEHNFKKPTKQDLNNFEKKIKSALRQMVYLINKHTSIKYTKSELLEMSVDLPEKMRTKNNIRNKSIK